MIFAVCGMLRNKNGCVFCSLMNESLMDNVYVRQDSDGNIKMDKEKSTEKIDAAVATVMALDRAIRNQGNEGSVYDGRGILVF